MTYHMDERLERLIVRCLDGEATPAEIAELNNLRSTDAAVRALWDEYAANDENARAALGSVLIRPTPAVAPLRARRGLWLATAAGVLAAAAAIGLSTVPLDQRWWSPPSSPIARVAGAQPPANHTQLIADEGVSRADTWQRIQPRRDVVNVQHGLLGVFDEKTKRVYFIGVDRRNGGTTPVSSEY